MTRALVMGVIFIAVLFVLVVAADNYYEARAECIERCWPDSPKVDLLRSPVTGIQSCYCDERYRAP